MYVNVKKDHINKYKMTVYYFWTLIENVAFAVLWFFRRDSRAGLNELLPSGLSLDDNVAELSEIPQMTALQLVCLVPAVNILGILVMIVYYMCFHPRIGCCNHHHDINHHQVEQVEMSPVENFQEKREAVEAKKSVNCRTWPRSSNSSCSSRTCSMEELMRDRKIANSSSDLNEAGKISGHQSHSSNLSLLLAPREENKVKEVDLSKSRYRTLPARAQSSCLHDKMQRKAAASENEKIDRLLEEKMQEKAWLQCRIDMQKRLSRIGPEFRSSGFPAFDGGHRTLPRQRSSPAASRGRTSRLGRHFSGATIRNSCVINEEAPQPTKESDFSSSIDYLENLDVFPPPVERVFNPRCKTYPRKRSEFSGGGHNSPLLKEMMRQRVNQTSGVTSQKSFAGTTMSLNDIAARNTSPGAGGVRPPTPLVLMSRTMSFTVRNDEIIDSIESSV